jgi:hypothetical protein
MVWPLFFVCHRGTEAQKDFFNLKLMHKDMPMKGLRRNDDAMKNKCWYQKYKRSIFA